VPTVVTRSFLRLAFNELVGRQLELGVLSSPTWTSCELVEIDVLPRYWLGPRSGPHETSETERLPSAFLPASRSRGQAALLSANGRQFHFYFSKPIQLTSFAH